MRRVAVFVDAGYLFAQGSSLLSGRKLPRGQIAITSDRVVAALTEFATATSGAELLRIYWYDGTSTGPSAQHLVIAHLDNVKLRLGFVNSYGEQKGVDSLIVTDMITLARNRAMSDAVLLTGDEDIRVGVQQAQEFGVRVHLLGIKPSRGSQSLFLLQESDTTHEWDAVDVSRFLEVREAPRPVTTEAGAAGDVVKAVVAVTVASVESSHQISAADAGEAIRLAAEDVALRLQLSELAAVIEAFDNSKFVPVQIDRQLLGASRSRTARDLGPEEKKRLREIFIERCRSRLTS